VKSYKDTHDDTHAVDQILRGIAEFSADAGLLITTGNPSEKLMAYIDDKVAETGFPIDLIAGDELARFVLRYAPTLLLGNEW